jgi:hypothetical protein
MTSLTPRFSKADIRQSLQASTLDGAFASIFDNLVKGVLISNFLLDLGAGAFEIGLLASVPMLAHFLQPLGDTLTACGFTAPRGFCGYCQRWAFC